MEKMTTAIERRPLTLGQRQALTAPLNAARVSERKQGGRNLSYLEAWDVKASLIKVFGFGGFSAEADQCEIMYLENNVPRVQWENGNKKVFPPEFAPDGTMVFGTANFRVTAKVRVVLTIHQTGAVYSEYAASSQTGPDIGEVMDFAIKTAESDALKRAAIYLGTQFGLSLYDDGSKNDVVKKVLAPGAEWPATPAEIVEWEEFMAEQQAIWAANNPDQKASDRPDISQPAEGVTPEQHAENKALVDKAVRSRRQKDQEQAQEPVTT